MLIITVQVDAPSGKAIGIKEDLAMILERYGDVKYVDVKAKDEPAPKQMTLGDHR